MRLHHLLLISAFASVTYASNYEEAYQTYIELPSHKQLMIFRNYRSYNEAPDQNTHLKPDHDLYLGYLEFLSETTRKNLSSTHKGSQGYERKHLKSKAIDEFAMLASESTECEDPELLNKQMSYPVQTVRLEESSSAPSEEQMPSQDSFWNILSSKKQDALWHDNWTLWDSDTNKDNLVQLPTPEKSDEEDDALHRMYGDQSIAKNTETAHASSNVPDPKELIPQEVPNEIPASAIQPAYDPDPLIVEDVPEAPKNDTAPGELPYDDSVKLLPAPEPLPLLPAPEPTPADDANTTEAQIEPITPPVDESTIPVEPPPEAKEQASSSGWGFFDPIRKILVFVGLLNDEKVQENKEASEMVEEATEEGEMLEDQAEDEQGGRSAYITSIVDQLDIQPDGSLPLQTITFLGQELYENHVDLQFADELAHAIADAEGKPGNAKSIYDELKKAIEDAQNKRK